jgi:16S rRNA (adenine1518-N6/adenine1519-N6)-dimethyltransferase
LELIVISLLGAKDIRDIASKLEVRPTKKLGQNFVIDPNTIRKIVMGAKLETSDKVVEIGPGLGSLTLGILEAVKEVAVVEYDSRLANQLVETLAERAPGSNCIVIEQDAMKTTTLPFEPDALVANLPYNISVPVLLHFLETFPSIHKGIVLVQAEVAARLYASPGSKVYGAPSAKLAWYAKAINAGAVSRNIFWPVPNVDSALVYFEKNDSDFSSEFRQVTFEAIDQAFAQRRKTLRQALASWAGSPEAAENLLNQAAISPKARGEELSVEDFYRLAKLK